MVYIVLIQTTVALNFRLRIWTDFTCSMPLIHTCAATSFVDGEVFFEVNNSTIKTEFRKIDGEERLFFS